MRTSVPNTQVRDAFSLDSVGVIDLFQIRLLIDPPVFLNITAQNGVEYLGTYYESLPCKMADSALDAGGEQSRPKFSVVNPDGMFSLFVGEKAVDGAIVSRLRVALSDLESNTAAYVKQTWIVSRVAQLNKDLIVMELRAPSDGQAFKLPARSFAPPDFPHVSLR